MQKISFEQYDDWSNNQVEIIVEDGFFDAEDAFAEEGVQFHEGNLAVDTLDVSPCVVVDGDLEVAGDISYAFERGLLVVKGNLKCKVFSFPFPTVVTGNVYAESINIDSGCDYWLTVGGDVYAESVIENGHQIKILGNVYAPIIKSYMNELVIGGKKLNERNLINR